MKPQEKVLVVEDNPDNMRLISYILQRNDYKVIEAMTGEDGVRLAEEQMPVFILMDIQLPGISGIEATKQIRASKADGKIPIIAITSYAQRGDREKALEAGCNGYFEKPFDPLILMDQIHEIVRQFDNRKK